MVPRVLLLPPPCADTYLRTIVPISALYAGTLWLGNAAYIYLSVSFIQMLKVGGECPGTGAPAQPADGGTGLLQSPVLPKRYCVPCSTPAVPLCRWQANQQLAPSLLPPCRPPCPWLSLPWAACLARSTSQQVWP